MPKPAHTSHPFFQAANISALIDLIGYKMSGAIGEKYTFTATDGLAYHIQRAAEDYPDFLLGRANDSTRLNDIVADRIVADLTEVDEAGQYWRGNALYKPTRMGKRCEREGTDPMQNRARVTLSGTMYQKYGAEFRKEELATRAAYDTDDGRFALAYPVFESDEKQQRVPERGARKVRMF